MAYIGVLALFLAIVQLFQLFRDDNRYTNKNKLGIYIVIVNMCFYIALGSREADPEIDLLWLNVIITLGAMVMISKLDNVPLMIILSLSVVWGLFFNLGFKPIEEKYKPSYKKAYFYEKDKYIINDKIYKLDNSPHRS